jgi:hypothetical protein
MEPKSLHWALLAGLVAAAVPWTTRAAAASPPDVDCNAGGSINAALRRLDRSRQQRLAVTGTCTENVVARGFRRLTLAGRDARLSAATPGRAVFHAVDSDFVALDGFTVLAAGTDGVVFSGTRWGRLRMSSVSGGLFGVVSEGSSLTVESSAIRDPDVFGVSVWGRGSVELRGTTVEETRPQGSGAWAGLWVTGSGSHAVVSSSTFRGFGLGISVVENASVVVENAAPAAVDPTVVEDNWFSGILVESGGTLNAFSDRPEPLLRVAGNSSVVPETGAGIAVQGGGALRIERSGGVDVVGNHATGLLVFDNSYAGLGRGVRISGNEGSGMVVANSSSVAVQGSTPVEGNARQDAFCDATSTVSGASLITGAATVSCANWVASRLPPVPQ